MIEVLWKEIQDLSMVSDLEERSEVVFRSPNFVIMIRNDRNYKKGLNWSRNASYFTK